MYFLFNKNKTIRCLQLIKYEYILINICNRGSEISKTGEHNYYYLIMY